MKIIDVRGKLPVHPSKKYKERLLNSIKYVAVHHSLTDDIPGGKDVEAFAKYHIDTNDWPGIGYHYVIDADGTVYKCNSASKWTYHVGEHNKFAIGICMVGDFRDDIPSFEQYDALIKLLKEIVNAYGIRPENILGHSEFKGYEWKKCPCIDMEQVRRDVSGAED